MIRTHVQLHRRCGVEVGRLSAFLLFLIVLSASAAPVLAQGGGLMINPKRIVFEGQKRNDVVTLYNNGNDTASFEVALIHYRMLEDGNMIEIPDSVKPTDIAYVDDMVRFFPKNVTIAPHGSQTVRMQLMKPKDLAVGEYRSHLYFKLIERAKALEETVHSDTGKIITLNLKAVYGLAIPIIVRNQTSPATVSIGNLNIKAQDSTGTYVQVDINRSGNESCYGMLNLTYKDPGGSLKDAGVIKGIGVYPPLPKRVYPMKVELPDGVKLEKGGVLKMEFSAMNGSDKGDTFGATEMVIK